MKYRKCDKQNTYGEHLGKTMDRVYWLINRYGWDYQRAYRFVFG